jgi:hypothetical protein
MGEGIKMVGTGVAAPTVGNVVGKGVMCGKGVGRGVGRGDCFRLVGTGVGGSGVGEGVLPPALGKLGEILAGSKVLGKTGIGDGPGVIGIVGS